MTSSQQKRNPNLRLIRTIVFVGLMGAGKSNIGRRMASYLDVPFFDSDREVELAAGMSVSDIFGIHGEQAFRDTERKIIRRLLTGPICVIATGGGAFINDQTRKTIAETGQSIWLRAPLEVLVERTSRSDKRPLLRTGDSRKILHELLEKRYPIYEKADIVVDSDERPAEITLELTVNALIDAGTIVEAL